jgi:putative transposase
LDIISLMVHNVQVSAGAACDLGLHVVCCPKYRRTVLEGQVGACLHELIEAKAAEHGWRFVACEILPDHGHLFVRRTPADCAAYVANQFKGYSSRILRAGSPQLRSPLPTLWSRSYFAATAGAVSTATVQRYIQTQYERPWRKERHC